MKAFVLTAGYGERLRPITDAMPKPLAPVMNVPCLGYAFALIKECGLREVVCNLHYRSDDIERFLDEKEGFGLSVEFSREDPILETGGGLKKCESLFRDEPVLLMNGDIVTDIDLGEVIRVYHERNLPALIVLRPVGPGETGTAAVEGDLVRDFRNTLGTGLAHGYDYTGMAVLSPEIFRYLSPVPTSIVYTAYIALAEQGRAGCHIHEGLWRDIGNPEQYRRANMSLLVHEDLQRRVARQTGLVPAAVSPGALIDNGALIERSVIGDECTIEGGAEVSESVVLPGCTIAGGRRLFRSVAVRNDLIITA